MRKRMTTATIEQLREKSQPATSSIEAGGLGFELRSLTAGGFCEYQQPFVEASQKGKKATPADRSKAIKQSQLVLIRRCVVAPDISGLSDEELLDLPPKLWTELTAACMEVSGLSDADAEDLAKNSEETDAGDSLTA